MDDIGRFRREYEAEVGGTEPATAAPRGGARAAAAISNRRRPPAQRVEAIVRHSAGAVEAPAVMDALVAVLGDPDEDDAVRVAALSALQQNAFSTASFGPWTAAYTQALRAAATADDPALRERALDVLALASDEYAQRLLTEGLQEPAKALVPPVKALRMIGYDVHAEQYEMLRDLAQNARQKAVRNQALRLLAADGGSKDLFARIASDKAEDPGARAASAVALQGLAPDEFATLARDVVGDDDDDDRVRATVITALAHGPADIDPDVGAKVQALAEAPAPPGTPPAATRQLRASARNFMRVTRS